MEMTLNEALAELGLSDYASISLIKKAYRELAHKYHPDKCKQKNNKDCEDLFKRIHHAKALLLEYCEEYPVPFSKKAVKEEAGKGGLRDHYSQFYGDWFGDVKK